MKVAMVCGSYPPQACGVGDYTFRLVEELRRMHVRVDVVTTDDDQRADGPAVAVAVRGWGPVAWWRALGRLRTGGYDILHIQYPARFFGRHPGHALLTLLARVALPQTRIVLTVHEFAIAHPLRKATIALMVLWAHRITVTTDAERRSLERWVPGVSQRMRKIPLAATVTMHAIPAGERKTLRETLAPGGETLIGYFGFLHPNKGIGYLLASFAHLRELRPAVRLLMLSGDTGTTHEYNTTVREEIVRRGIRESVTWTEFLPAADVSRYLQVMDICVLPFADGVTLRRTSFVAAMMHGLPVVTTAGADDPGEIGLRDGDNIVLVPRSDPLEGARRMTALVDDPALRSAIGTAARAWCVPLQWDAVVRDTRELYQSVHA